MRRPFFLILLLAAALLLGACSQQETTTVQPESGITDQSADKRPGTQVIFDDPLLLALQDAMTGITDADFDYIEVKLGGGKALCEAYSTVQKDMPPIQVSVDLMFAMADEFTFEVGVPYLRDGQPWYLPGNCVPIRYRTDMAREIVEAMIITVPYWYFNDRAIATPYYRTFDIGEDDEGHVYPINVFYYTDPDFDPLGDDPHLVTEISNLRVPPQTEVVETFIDPEGYDDDY